MELVLFLPVPVQDLLNTANYTSKTTMHQPRIALHYGYDLKLFCDQHEVKSGFSFMPKEKETHANSKHWGDAGKRRRTMA